MSRSLEIFREYGYQLNVGGGLSHDKMDKLTREIEAEVSDESTPQELIVEISDKAFHRFAAQKMWLNRVLSAAMSNVNVDGEFWFKYAVFLGHHSHMPIHVDYFLAKALTHPLMALFFETHEDRGNDLHLRDRILVAYGSRFTQSLFSTTPLMSSIDQWRKGTAWNAKLGRKLSSLKRGNKDMKEFAYKFFEYAMTISSPSLVAQIGVLLSFDDVFDRVYEKFWQETRSLQVNDLVQMPESPPRSRTVDQLRKVFRGDV